MLFILLFYSLLHIIEINTEWLTSDQGGLWGVGVICAFMGAIFWDLMKSWSHHYWKVVSISFDTVIPKHDNLSDLDQKRRSHFNLKKSILYSGDKQAKLNFIKELFDPGILVEITL